jgi:hypothetical protein
MKINGPLNCKMADIDIDIIHVVVFVLKNRCTFAIATLSHVLQNLFVMTRKFKQWWQEEFEDTNGAIRIRLSKKDRQHNSTNINKTNNHSLNPVFSNS